MIVAPTMNGSTGQNKLCIIGSCLGGEPNTLLPFSGSTPASATLRGGDALKASKIAWNPSPDKPGASPINVVRVNSAVQASNVTDFLDIDGVTILADVWSRDYGIWTNTISWKLSEATEKKAAPVTGWLAGKIEILSVSSDTPIEDDIQFDFLISSSSIVFNGGDAVAVEVEDTATALGTTGAITFKVLDLPTSDEEGTVSVSSQGIKITVEHQPSGAVETQNNLGSVFAIKYTGDADTCVVSITGSGSNKTLALTPSTSTDGSRALSINLSSASFDTTLKVVNYINGQVGYTAELSRLLVNSSLPAVYLDGITNTSIKACSVILTANLGTVFDWVNNNSSLIELVLPEDRSISGTPGPTGAFKELTGGNEGTNTITEWTQALAMLEKEEVDYIVPITTDAAILALVKEHVVTMTNNKKERRAYMGHAVGKSVADIRTLHASVQSAQTLLLSPGIKLMDDDGAVRVYDSSFAAAAAAGIVAGSDSLAESLTFKYLNILGLEKIYSDDDVNILLDSGISTIEFAPRKGFRITWGRTTYVLSEQSVFVEDSCNRVALFIQRDIREYLEDAFCGKNATPASLTSMLVALTSKLQTYASSGFIVEGIDKTTGKAVSAFRNVSIKFANGVVNATYEVSPVEPINFILLTASFVPVSIVA
jgi:hypothetical protein